ncbi:MAG: AAA family ATPase [Bacteroidales bacterium]|nr:AAA family ATPase [Bacteroidales bacterium]
MKRKIYDQLLLWKNKRKGKSAMMIEGARRVGKSYIVKEFAQKEYKSYILIDFFKVGDDIKDLFKKYSTHLAQAYIVHTGDVEKDGDYLYIPLYMVPCL